MNVWVTISKLRSKFIPNVRARCYPFVANVELVNLESDIQMQGRVTDLSLYGCGTNTSKPFPAGTKIRIKVINKGRTFSAIGKVAYATTDTTWDCVCASRTKRSDDLGKVD